MRCGRGREEKPYLGGDEGRGGGNAKAMQKEALEGLIWSLDYNNLLAMGELTARILFIIPKADGRSGAAKAREAASASFLLEIYAQRIKLSASITVIEDIPQLDVRLTSLFLSLFSP
jgi:hypothetical protein